MSNSILTTGNSAQGKTESEEEEELLQKKSDEDTCSDHTSEEELLLKDDVTFPRIGSEDDVAPRIGSEDDVAPRIGSEDDMATIIESQDDVSPRIGSEIGLAPRIRSKDCVAPRIESKYHVDAGIESQDDVAPGIGTEDGVAPRIGSKDDMALITGSENGVALRIESQDYVTPRIESEDVVASRIGSECGVVPRIDRNLTKQSGFCSRTKKRRKNTSRCIDEMANDKKRLKSSSFRTNKRKKTEHIDENKRCNEKSVNILLVGKAGSGKSTIGNMISGENLFHVSSQAQLVTTECQIETVHRDGVKITVVDSPGSFSLEMESSTVQAKIRKCLEDHPNIFPLICVLCIPAGVRFTKEDKAMINNIEENFGTCVLQNLMVVFTGNLPMISDVKNNPKWFNRFLDNIGNRTFHFKTDSSEREVQESSFIKACQMLLKKTEYLNYNFSDYQTAQRLI